MKKIYILFCILFLIIDCNKKNSNNVEVANEEIVRVKSTSIKTDDSLIMDPDCVEFVALWSAGDIADKIGKDKKWVFLNYTVDIWDTPPSEGIGKTVGILRASSYAQIIQKKGNDYMVESPINKAQGWISNDHVKTISWKNPKTKALCK